MDTAELVEFIDQQVTNRRLQMLAVLRASRDLAKQDDALADTTTSPNATIARRIDIAQSEVEQAKACLQNWAEASLAHLQDDSVQMPTTALSQAREKLRTAEMALTQGALLHEQMQEDDKA